MPSARDTSPEPDDKPRLRALQRRAAEIQHTVSNPLAALLAEAQLLQLDPALGTEQRAALDRMVELVRRVTSAVKQLDELRGEGAGEAGPGA